MKWKMHQEGQESFVPSNRDSRSAIEPTRSPSPYIDQRASTPLEYVYQAAILVTVLLLLWTVSV